MKPAGGHHSTLPGAQLSTVNIPLCAVQDSVTACEQLLARAVGAIAGLAVPAGAAHLPNVTGRCTASTTTAGQKMEHQ